MDIIYRRFIGCFLICIAIYVMAYEIDDVVRLLKNESKRKITRLQKLYKFRNKLSIFLQISAVSYIIMFVLFIVIYGLYSSMVLWNSAWYLDSGFVTIITAYPIVAFLLDVLIVLIAALVSIIKRKAWLELNK